jgi:dephospho-CoA kinase
LVRSFTGRYAGIAQESIGVMIILGITGSIAMGKSTVTNMFETCGAATANADIIVHNLYTQDPQVIEAVESKWPAVIEGGKVNRKKLGDAVFGDKAALAFLEHLIHPKVQKVEKDFVVKAETEGKWLVVLDIPLLYESGAESRCDYVAVVSCPAEQQKARAMSRPGMTEEKYAAILARQVPDSEKRKRADFIIDTGKTLLHSEADVKRIIRILKERTVHA